MQTDQIHPPDTVQPPVDPLIGRTLNGRFQVLESIGSGGMGKVYRALQMPLERVVALKVLSPTFPVSKDPGFLERFTREASLTAKLRNPHTVTVIDYGQTDDSIYFIAMEYLEGRTLADVLAAGPLPWPRAIEVARQICSSLREAHRLGVVHRDLKPANVMLLDGGGDRDHVKVLDFGLVKPLTPEGDAQVTPGITQSGTFLGSPTYMAPEQARNLADTRSDIYSLGVLTWHMLMGRPPFVSRDTLELLFAHHKELPPAFRDVRPDLAVPEAVEALVRRCLEKAPAARFPSMEALLEALRAVVGQGDSVPRSLSGGSWPALASVPPAEGSSPGTLVLDISLDVPPESPPVPRRRAGPWGGAALGALVLLGMGAFWLWGWRPEPPAVAAVPNPTPVAAKVAPVARAAPVRFHIESEPTGARVFWQGQERGVTPLVLEVPPGDNGMARAELTFDLEGYQTERVVMGGSGAVLFTHRLQKARAPRGKGAPAGGLEGRGLAFTGGNFQAPELLEAERPVKVAAPPPPPVMPEVKKVVRPPGPVQLPEGARPPVDSRSNVQPEFPPEMRARGREGLVILKLVVTREGQVEAVTVMRGEEPFASAAVAAVRTWRYSPALLDGNPLAVYRVVKIPFRLR